MVKIKRNCVYCGESVERYPSQVLRTVYCSKQCRSKHYQENHTILFNCDFCGKEKRIRKANYKADWNHHFCSKTCKDEWQKEGLKGENNPFFNKTHSVESRNKVSKTKIESELRGENSPQYNRLQVECTECGKADAKIPYLIKRSKYHFCSVKCHGIWKSKYNVGENNPSWNPKLTAEERETRRKYPEYYLFSTTVMRRDNYTCDICKKRGSELSAHHLNSYDWDKANRTNPENGITLCRQCHTKFHKSYGYGKNTKEQYIEFKESVC